MMPFRLLVVATTLALAPLAAQAELESQNEKFSYALGFQIASQIKQRLQQDNLEIDGDAFSQAVSDIMGDVEPRLTQEQMQAALSAEQERRQQEMEALAQENLQASEAFLAENRDRDGVKETDSGLQYEVLEEGDGASPAEEDTVVVHYQGTLPDGTVFDSSRERGEPASFQLSGIIPAWQEALPMMKEGGKWRLYVPPKLAYGQQGAGNVIGPNQALVFEIELLEVK